MDISERLSHAMQPLEELVRNPTGFQQAVKTWVLLRDARNEIDRLGAENRVLIAGLREITEMEGGKPLCDLDDGIAACIAVAKIALLRVG